MLRHLLIGCWFVLVGSRLGAEELPLLVTDDFENGMDQWQSTDDNFWKITELDRNGTSTHGLRVLGKSDYEPPVRSPHSIAWLRDVVVSDFVLTVKVESTNYKAGNHRDLCLFWGRQDPSHFYYVHFGAKADPHACQIFIVDGKARAKITVDEAKGTPWGKAWHVVRVERTVADGKIRVYFDDMERPMMTAQDDTFKWGQVGLGTFDDNGNFDDFELRGVKFVPKKR